MTYRAIEWSLAALALAGCVEKHAFVADDGPLPVPPGTTGVSVARLLSEYRGYPSEVKDDWQLDVVVTANDRFGSFRNALWVRDSTGGIQIKVSGDELFLDFPVGQPLRVRCQGLVLGDYAGEVSLGATSDDPAYPNGFIARDDRIYYLKPYGEPGEALPDTATFAGLDDRRLGSLVAFERVQFVDEELSLAWCDPDADTNRHLVDCRGDTLVVRTSCRADFAYRVCEGPVRASPPKPASDGRGIVREAVRFSAAGKSARSLNGYVRRSGRRIDPAQAFSFWRASHSISFSVWRLYPLTAEMKTDGTSGSSERIASVSSSSSRSLLVTASRRCLSSSSGLYCSSSPSRMRYSSRTSFESAGIMNSRIELRSICLRKRVPSPLPV